MSSHHIDPDTPQPEGFSFNGAMMAEAKKHIAKYPKGCQRSAVMPLLDLAQRQEGWLSRTAMEYVAEMLGMPPIRVFEVATFYSMYRLRPVGACHIQICTNIACWLRGSDEVKRAAEEVFGVAVGSSNAAATVEEVECAGACVNAPVVQIGDDYFEDLTYESAKSLFEAVRDGGHPAPGPQNGRQMSCPVGRPTTLNGEG